MGIAEWTISFSPHALQRAKERFPEYVLFDQKTLNRVLLNVCRRGELYGYSSQLGGEFYKSMIGDKPIVFCLVPDALSEYDKAVKTILTIDEAHNNTGFIPL